MAKKAANTIYVFDISGSMNDLIQGYNGPIPKIQALKEAFTILLAHKSKYLPQDLIGCVLFGSQALVLFKPTNPRNPWIRKQVAGIKANGGGTNMAAGLELAIQLLEQRHPKYIRNLTLLSDGCATCSKDSVLALARRAFNSRININTIGFGDAPHQIDEALLKAVAQTTHRGQYTHVRNLSGLARALLMAA